MNNKKGGFGAKLLLVLILMIASAAGGAYGYSVLDGKIAARDALKAVENVDVSDYDTAEQSVIQGYIDDAKKDLETAKTRKDVYEIISEFIKDVDKVQTKAEKQLEQALKEAEEAKSRYENQNQNQNQSQDQIQDNNGSESTTEAAENVDNSNNSSNSSSSDEGGYKSNDLSEGQDGTEENGGFLDSLFGGLVNGANGD